MLKERIIFTLRFFDLQDTPLTLLELHKFLLADKEVVSGFLDKDWEVMSGTLNGPSVPVAVGDILACLEKECGAEVECDQGFYALRGRRGIIALRLGNYLHGIKREQYIKKFINGTRFLPFTRGIGLVGSQAMGQQKPTSDIDLLILTAPGFMWLARAFVTAYFQILGRRRHGSKVADRFCLNHYVVVDKKLDTDKNLYTAAEYLKLRPLVYPDNLKRFQYRNQGWIAAIYPHTDFAEGGEKEKRPLLQKVLESVFRNRLGQWLEKFSGRMQHRRLKVGEFVIAQDDELSFHPNNRKKELFARFFQLQKQDQREAEHLVRAVEP